MRVPARRIFSRGGVDVWSADLADGGPARDLHGWLDPDELARAARMPEGVVRDRFASARGILRGILGAYLSADPRQLRFAYGGRGKPELQPGPLPRVHFNVSHSGAGMVCAVSFRFPVGIDLERIRVLPELPALVQRHWTDPEKAALRRLDPSKATEAFYCWWTSKEAVSKCFGSGILLDWDGYSVRIDPESDPGILDPEPPGAPALRCALTAIDAGPGYACVLASAEDRGGNGRNPGLRARKKPEIAPETLGAAGSRWANICYDLSVGSTHPSSLPHQGTPEFLRTMLRRQ